MDSQPAAPDSGLGSSEGYGSGSGSGLGSDQLPGLEPQSESSLVDRDYD